MQSAVGEPVVLTTLAPPRVSGGGHWPAFGACVQSIEYDRGARSHPHQIRCSLAKPLADILLPLREGSIEARAKRCDGGFGAAMKLIIQTAGECRRSARSSF